MRAGTQTESTSLNDGSWLGRWRQWPKRTESRSRDCTELLHTSGPYQELNCCTGWFKIGNLPSESCW